LCQRPIGDAREGAFCERCGNPLHTNCLIAWSATTVGEGRCPACGADPQTTVAVAVRAERAKVVGPTQRPDVGAPQRRAGIALGFLGCLLVIVGSMLPLVEGSLTFELPDGRGKEVRTYVLTAFDFAGVGNTLLAFAAMGGVFLGTKCPRGVLAIGVAVVVLVVPLLWQIVPGTGASTNPQVAALQAKLGGGVEVGFGWLAWCAVVAGASLLVVAAALELRGEAKPAGC
jgi:hypothetical protein